MTHQFKVGDRVRIKTDLSFGSFNGIWVVEEMLGYRGKTTTITKIKLVSIELGIDGGKWAWAEDMLEPATKSLEELEVGDCVKYGEFLRKGGECAICGKEHLNNHINPNCLCSRTCKPHGERGEVRYTTPKKITVFKHKGKRYPVTEIIKKVKSL